MRMERLGYIAALLLFLSSCGGNDNATKTFEDNTHHDDAAISEPQISTEALVDIINSIPPPIELSVLIKEVGGEYSKAPLNPTSNSSKYSTNFKKAVNLGVYGADLGYISLYDQSPDAIDCLAAVKELADELSIGHFFDFETIQNLAANKHNLDSLVFVSTQNFAKMNDYLKENNRVNLSVLMLTGGWLEGLHIAGQIAKDHDSKELNERIGEQKIILNQVMELLKVFQSNPDIKVFADQMKELQALYNNVEIITTYEESSLEEVDGVLMVVDNTSSEVKISAQLLKEITEKVEEIRKTIIE